MVPSGAWTTPAYPQKLLLTGFSAVAPASRAERTKASTVLGWETTSETVNPRKPLVGSCDSRTPTTSPRSKASLRKPSAAAESSTSRTRDLIPAMSLHLVESDGVAGRVAERAVARPPGLLGGLLHHLGVAGLELLEEGVKVLGGQGEHGVGALGHHLGDHPALVVGDPRVGPGREEDQVDVGLSRRPDREPVHPVVAHVVAELETEGVAVERDSGVAVGVREERVLNLDVHAENARRRAARVLLDS